MNISVQYIAVWRSKFYKTFFGVEAKSFVIGRGSLGRNDEHINWQILKHASYESLPTIVHQKLDGY